MAAWLLGFVPGTSFDSQQPHCLDLILPCMFILFPGLSLRGTLITNDPSNRHEAKFLMMGISTILPIEMCPFKQTNKQAILKWALEVYLAL